MTKSQLHNLAGPAFLLLGLLLGVSGLVGATHIAGSLPLGIVFFVIGISLLTRRRTKLST